MLCTLDPGSACYILKNSNILLLEDHVAIAHCNTVVLQKLHHWESQQTIVVATT